MGYYNDKKQQRFTSKEKLFYYPLITILVFLQANAFYKVLKDIINGMKNLM